MHTFPSINTDDFAGLGNIDDAGTGLLAYNYRIGAGVRSGTSGTAAGHEARMAKQDLAHTLFDTTFGTCGLAWSSRGVTRLQLPEQSRAMTAARLSDRASAVTGEQVPAAIAEAIGDLQRYFAGETIDLSTIEVDLAGVPAFFTAIYGFARTIGWGELSSYGELASRAGSPGSARAVGQAMARNPVPIIIPCHRVLAANRRIGGFSAFGGTVTKERLLAMEGVSLIADAPLLAMLEATHVKTSAGSRS